MQKLISFPVSAGCVLIRAGCYDWCWSVVVVFELNCCVCVESGIISIDAPNQVRILVAEYCWTCSRLQDFGHQSAWSNGLRYVLRIVCIWLSVNRSRFDPTSILWIPSSANSGKSLLSSDLSHLSWINDRYWHFIDSSNSGQLQIITQRPIETFMMCRTWSTWWLLSSTEMKVLLTISNPIIYPTLLMMILTSLI